MADGYNPVDHRDPATLTETRFSAFMHLLKCAMGSGILVLPYAFSKSGYVAAFLASIFIGALTTHTAVIMVQSSQLLCRRTQRPALTMAETAQVAFEFGPGPMQRFAGVASKVVLAIVCFVQYQITIVYTLYVATSCQQIIEYIGGFHASPRIYVAALLPVLLIFSLTRDMKMILPMTLLGTFFLFYGIFATFYYLLKDIPDPGRLSKYTSFQELGIYSAIFLFSMHNMGIVLPMENSMKNPEHAALVLASSMVVNIVLLMVFGFFGYNKYLQVCDTIIKNLPLDDPLSQSVKVCVTLSVLFSYPLQIIVPVKLLWPAISRKINSDRYLYEAIFRLGGCTLCTLVGVAVPMLAPVLGLLAAISMTTNMLLLPVLIETVARWGEPGVLRHYAMIVKNIIIVVLYFFFLIFGVLENVKSIIQGFRGEHDEPDVCKGRGASS